MANPCIDGRAECSHLPEAHVSYDKRGWRAWAYCRCRKVQMRGKRLYGAVADAEAAAVALLDAMKAASSRDNPMVL